MSTAIGNPKMKIWSRIEVPDLLSAKAETIEVMDVFEKLYELSDRSCLPPEAVIRPYTDEAYYHGYRDNTPQWEDEGLPDDALHTYAEVISYESAKMHLDAKEASHVIIRDFCTPQVHDAIEKLVPPRMTPYAPWISGDLANILLKRFALDRRPSRIETMFQIYRAGYFPFGWTGEYPSNIRFLVFPARED